MAYIPDPTDVTQPDDSVIAETAAAEFRALKVYIQGLTLSGVPGPQGDPGPPGAAGSVDLAAVATSPIGDVGTYAFLVNANPVAAGAIYSAPDLFYSSANDQPDFVLPVVGNWRAMGSNSLGGSATLYLRVS